MLFSPRVRRNEATLALAPSTWAEKYNGDKFETGEQAIKSALGGKIKGSGGGGTLVLLVGAVSLRESDSGPRPAPLDVFDKQNCLNLVASVT